MGECAFLLFITYNNRIFTNQNYFIMKRITLLLLLIYTTLASSQVKVYNTEVKYKKTPNLSVVDSILTKDNNDLLSATSVADFTTQIGLDNYLQNIVEDTSPQLGGSLDINFQNINGNGNIDFTGYLKNNGDVIFSAYPQSRDDGTASNFLFTDSNGKIQSTQLTQLDSKYLQLTGGTITNNLTIDGLSILDDLRFVKSGVINYIQSGNERVASSWNDIIFSPYGTTINPKFRIGEALNTSYNDFIAPNFIGNGSQLTNVDAIALDGIGSSQFARTDSNNTFDGNISLTDTDSSLSHELFFENDTSKMGIDYKSSRELRFIDRDNTVVRGSMNMSSGTLFMNGGFIGNGSQLTNVDAIALDGIGSSQFARTDVSNTFSALQTFKRSASGQITPNLGSSNNMSTFIANSSGSYGLGIYVSGNGQTYLQGQRIDGNNTTYKLNIQSEGGATEFGGNIVNNVSSTAEGITVQTPSESIKLDASGLTFDRSVSYLRPNSNATKALYIGGFTPNTSDWTDIKFNGTAEFQYNNNDIFHEGNFGKTEIDALGIDAITLNGNTDYARESVSNTFSQLQTINQTVAQIDAAPDKTVPTKEWVQANSGGLPINFYEEGTFTPVLIDQAGGGTYSYTVDVAKYVRIGNSVTFSVLFKNVNTSGTPTGFLRVTGMPFDFSHVSEQTYNFNCQVFGGNVSFDSIQGAESAGAFSSSIDFKITQVGGGTANRFAYQAVTFTGNGILGVSGTYITDVYTP